MCSQLFPAHCRKVSRCNVKYGLASGYTLVGQTLCGSRISNQNAGGKFRVGIQLQAILDDMLVASISGRTAADDKATVRDALVLRIQLFL